MPNTFQRTIRYKNRTRKYKPHFLTFFIFFFKLKFVSRLFFALFVVLSAGTILLEKIAIFYISHYMRKQGYNYRRILLVGTGKRASDFIKKIDKHPEWGIRISGVVDDEPKRGVKKVNNINVVGPINNISDMLHRYAVEEGCCVVPR